MSKKIIKLAALSLVATGLAFSAGQVFGETDDSKTHPPNEDIHESSKIEKRLEKVEKKTESVQSVLEEIKASLENSDDLTEEEIQTYHNDVDSFQNRLDAAENHLDAVTKKLGESSPSVEETKALIDDVRANVSQVDETLESNLEEENNEENEDARMHEHLTSSGEVPDNLKEAENPAYEVGSEAIIEAEHSDEGYLMRGAEATIVGAYDTTAYSVSFTPKTGGEPVENHKWVIHEELEEPDEAPLQPESEVTLKASHMVGMYNTKATIDSAEETTVYMINFTSPSGEEKVENHKWVIEKELALVE